MMRWHFPLDPGCPVVQGYHRALYEDPMTACVPGDVLRDIQADWSSSHRAKCPRCQEHGAANVEVAD